MRTFLSIILLFSLCGASAQHLTPSKGLELSRGQISVYPTEELAMQADSTANRYRRNLGQWEISDGEFRAPFIVPFAWINRQIILHLEWVSGEYTVKVNGRKVGTSTNGYLPTDFNITKYAKEGRNELIVKLKEDSKYTALEDWRTSSTTEIGESWVMSQPTLRVRDVLVKAWQGEAVSEGATGEVGIVVKTSSLNPRTSRFYYALYSPAGDLVTSGKQDITLDMRGEDTLRFVTQVPQSQLWSAASPKLYSLRIKTQHEGRYDEYLQFKVGFRSIEMQQDQMLINGKKEALHVRELSPSATQEEVAKVKSEGYNTIKLLPGAVRYALLEQCDTMGIYVIAQAPIDTHKGGLSRQKRGNVSNNPTWKGEFIERAERMYHATKRHPSVIAFSIAHESANGINLYESYLNMKRMDDSRPVIYLNSEGEWNNDPLKLE